MSLSEIDSPPDNAEPVARTKLALPRGVPALGSVFEAGRFAGIGLVQRGSGAVFRPWRGIVGGSVDVR